MRKDEDLQSAGKQRQNPSSSWNFQHWRNFNKTGYRGQVTVRTLKVPQAGLLEFLDMDSLMKVLAPALEYLFFIGMAGSVIVIVISAIEDIYTILEKD